MCYVASPQRINISSKTFYILKCDENCFSVIKSKKNNNRITDTLINTIICNMDITDICEDDNVTYKTCPENKKFNFKPSKKSNQKLEANDIKYIGSYVSRLLEIYASKAYYERELIYYKDCIEKIQDIIARKDQLLCIQYRNKDKKRLIYPYKVLTDEWSSYNYLIGTEITDAKSKDQERLVDLRIAYISEYQAIKKRSEHPELRFTNTEIDEKIFSSGVQFVSAEPIEIKVKFTEKGKDMYDHMVFMRPTISEMPASNTPDIYTFNCTPAQASYYFFKFGADVEIISPEKLRKEFADKYRNALSLYKDC